VVTNAARKSKSKSLKHVYSTSTKLSLAKKGSLFAMISGLFLLSLFLLSASSEKPAGYRRIINYSVNPLNQISINLSIKVHSYENISQQFITNQDLNQLLTNYVQDAELYDVSSQNKRFANFLDGFAFTDPDFYDAIFIDERNPKRKALTMGESLSYHFVKTFRNTAWFHKIVQADGQVLWFPGVRVDESGQHYFLLGRRIKNLFSEQPIGVLLLVIQEKTLCYMINNNYYGEDHQLKASANNEYTLMIDKQGVIISSPLKNSLNHNIRQFLGISKSPFQIVRDGQSHGSVLVNKPQKSFIVVLNTVGDTKWYLANIIPIIRQTKTWSSQFPMLRGLITVLLILSLLSAVYLGFLILIHLKSLLTFSPQPSVITDLIQKKPPVWLENLSEREKEVLCLLAYGYDNKEIAKRLYVAEQTVKNYVSAIYGKLDVHDRVQASLKAIEAGLVSNNPASHH
jgi:DNA-binding CsgD family transcriptional regulator